MFIVRYDSFVKLIFSTFCPDLAHKSWIRFIDI
jgi:hypothetical protein